MSNHTPLGTGSFRLPKSTIIVGILAMVFTISAAFSSGFGGVLVILALFGLLTGLYVLATGRRSWALLRGGRKAGAVVLAGALVFMIVGAAITPPRPKDPLQASQAAAEAQKLAPASESPSASPIPTPSDTGAPLDPETTTELAKTATYTAPHSQPTYATKALELLVTLPIKGRAPKTGYDRDQFGQAWADVDRNGCDTRNDTLKRDLTQVTFTNSVQCKIQTGSLADPYTAKNISFVRGSATSSAVQIDHVVALSDAWQKGAQQLSLEQRTAFANDPLNLQSTDGPTNTQKGDGDTATWLPPNKSFRCDYVARQISVKATYNLWVTQGEHDAMTKVLGDCKDQIAPTNEKAPAPPSAVATTPAPAEPAPAQAAIPAPVPY
ncbi:HNH endonuclease family protein, partial [Arthrobacter sp. 18067]|uniref:HNH endonuclease family protein n=1 Tax=Arthrobacter sp. 18067 TaxID=2681413 RepID=UPI001F2CD1A6